MAIRNVRIEDVPKLLKIYAPYVEETAISFELEVPTTEDFEDRIERITSEYPYIVYEEDDEILGYAYAGQFHGREAYRHCVETSIYVRKDSHKAGIGKTLYEYLEKELLKQNVFILYACITKPTASSDPYLTDGSIRFHEKLGYKMVGVHESCGYKFQRWYSVCWMEKRIMELPSNPAPFVPYINATI